MYIKEIIRAHNGRPTLSFEMFPPKREDALESVTRAMDRMCGQHPAFISVTYGAGGGGNTNKTADIAEMIKQRGVEPLAHLTAVGASVSQIDRILDDCAARGVDNIMALRGDLPEQPAQGDYTYAKDLIAHIRARGGFCIGAACYPEGHITCGRAEESDEHLLQKQEAGADFAVSQLFFDNSRFLRFWERVRGKGVTIPILAGIMPILSKSQVQRMIFTCGVSLPSDIIRILYKYESDPESLAAAGIEQACRQVRALLEAGVDGVHIYSMNRPEIAIRCKQVYDERTAAH